MDAAAETAKSDKEKTPGFEEALARLEASVAEMESGRQTLEQSLKLFEEGMALSKLCAEKLAATEKKIEILVKRADRSLEWESVEAEDLGTGLSPEAAR